MKPRIVLSGVNFVEGGPLAVFQDALKTLADEYLDEFEVIALVHRKELLGVQGITYLEFPEVKSSWLHRLKFEYHRCRRLSEELHPHLWLAMHDITPNVTANIRAVYCHNPAPFYRLSLREAQLDPTFALFRLFYRFLYLCNISKNDFVVVQQDWIRAEFRRRFHPKTVVVAHPSIPSLAVTIPASAQPEQKKFRFFYPALARSFKNFEVILRAVRELESLRPNGFELLLTIDGTENRYAATLRRDFADLKSVSWLGKLPRSEVDEIYQRADCLVFPSKLETWGMPISEWKRTGKPMLVADLPYSHETVGEYGDVAFASVNGTAAWTGQMFGLLSGQSEFGESAAPDIAEPFAKDWKALFQILLGKQNTPSEGGRR